MDLKGFVNGGKKGTGKAGLPHGLSENDMSQLSGMVKGFESKSREELLEDLRKAKRDGNINDSSVKAFFSAVSGVLPAAQQEEMKKILDSLE